MNPVLPSQRDEETKLPVGAVSGQGIVPLAVAFGLPSLLAVAAGCFVVAFTGSSTSVWARNAAAWAVGALLPFPVSALVVRVRPGGVFRAILLLVPLLLLLTLFSLDQSGVHRWIDIGPLHWKVAFLTLPAAVVAIAGSAQTCSVWPPLSAMVIATILCLQPDASQATAFAVAMLVTLLAALDKPRPLMVACGFVAIAAAVAWLQQDPLQPVPEVEGIVDLAAGVHPLLRPILVLLLAWVSLAPLWLRKPVSKQLRQPARALTAYFVACAIMPLCGAFPVPILGMGMSPILGFWLGIATLSAVPYRPQLDQTNVNG